MIDSDAKVESVYCQREWPRVTATFSVPQVHSEPAAVAT